MNRERLKRRLPDAPTGFKPGWIPVCLFILFLTVGGSPARAAEFLNGRIKLVLHEDTGRFSLYYLVDRPPPQDTQWMKYEPFFVDTDPRSTFLTVMVNDRTYRLGDSISFQTQIRRSAVNPAIIFSSPFLVAAQEFTFIKTAGAPMVNGVRMTIRLENRGNEQFSAGVRFLLDTHLGEENPPESFTIGGQPVSSEFIIDAPGAESYWVSRNPRFGLIGSVASGKGSTPDQIHFANWKRLNEVPWKPGFIPGRNFNYLPYSINDSAVSYYFDPRTLAAGASREYVILLASLDERGFLRVEDAPAEASLINNLWETDLIALRELITQLDNHLSGRASLSDEKLREIETAIADLEARYKTR
ncbi:MAG: hypothetical protein LBH70_00530 [Spirochaetaceae bacterium]|jgi:hypothetical protein|nr:hypothetical protein [Spirochaetaceae bacterium]